jgi:hypothetical protein
LLSARKLTVKSARLRGEFYRIMASMARPSMRQRLVACCAVAALGFAQVAIAALTPPAGPLQMARVSAQSGSGCHEADPGAKHACIKTCQAEPQTHTIPVLAALPPGPDPGLRVAMPAPATPSCRARAEGLRARAASPPPRLLFARLLE